MRLNTVWCPLRKAFLRHPKTYRESRDTMATTLESLVSRFRRETSDRPSSKATIELEVRFQSIDYANFESILQALLSKKLPVDDGTIVHTVDSIMVEKASRAPHNSDASQKVLRPQRVRQMYFENGKKTVDKYVYKAPMVAPFKVANPFALSYTVALSSETDDPVPFSSDEGAIIRVKARVGFKLLVASAATPTVKLPWRIDMTVVRQINGADAQTSLKGIVDGMFKTPTRMTPQNLPHVLRLDDASAGARQLYRYEIECEFLGGPDRAVRDSIRPSDISAVADAILQLSNPEYLQEAVYQAEVYHVARYIVAAPGFLRRFEHELGLKRLVPQVIALTRADYRAIYPPVGYLILDKADGFRCLVSVREGRARVLANKMFEFTAAIKPGEHPDKRARLTNDTIVDAEAIIETSGTKEKLTVYVFDVIALQGEDIGMHGYEKRVESMPQAVAILKEFGISAEAKPYVHITSDDPAVMKTQIESLNNAKRPYHIDGLIPVEPGKPYADTVSYKWKDLAENTIDFVSRKCPSSVAGKAPFISKAGHTLHFLFVGVSPEMFDSLGLQWCPGYSDIWGPPEHQADRGQGRREADERVPANTGSYFPVQFSPSDCPLAYLYQHPSDSEFGEIDRKVIELRCTGGCIAAGGGSPTVAWEMVKMRDDRTRDLQSRRYYGNDFRTAELTWLNYVDPFPIDQLWNGPALNYFSRPKAGIYRAPTAFTSFVKTQRIMTLRGLKWVVDLGVGQGQDLRRYIDAGIGNLVGIDQDRAAIAELVRRKYTHARQAHRGQRGRADRREADDDDDDHPLQSTSRSGHRRNATVVRTLIADLSQPFGETVEQLKTIGAPMTEGVDAVVANLMIHYFMGSTESMKNFVALCCAAVKPGGQVLITAMMGSRVHHLFANSKIKEGQSWDAFEDGVLKYSLKRLYTSADLEKAGQKIGVLLPFSDGHLYEEYLVNFSALTDEFVKRGFRCSSMVPFDRHMDEFRPHNQTLYDLLTAEDKTYLGLYGEIGFTKGEGSTK